GRWPEPELLEEIIDAGESIVGPLLEVMTGEPYGWSEDPVIRHAIGLLSILRTPSAIPVLVDLIKYCDDPIPDAHFEDDGSRVQNDDDFDLGSSVRDAAVALAKFGAPGLEALLDLCRDPLLDEGRRIEVIAAASRNSSDDRIARARLAEVLRADLAEH